MKTILKTLVGSQAHGLAGPDSDYDYRGVFVVPTSEILSLGSETQTTTWLEGSVDNTAHEVSRFLFLSTKCNPTLLEVFVGKTYEADEWGEELRELFPCVWNSKGVRDAFCGYGKNQQTKALKGERSAKYATAYVRSLFNAWQLLLTGWFDLDVRGTEIEAICRKFRSGDFTLGEMVDTCLGWEQKVNEAYGKFPHKPTDFETINKFLLRLRKEHWM